MITVGRKEGLTRKESRGRDLGVRMDWNPAIGEQVTEPQYVSLSLLIWTVGIIIK